MKTRLLAAAFALSFVACTNSPVGHSSSASGSIAVTHDDALLYAADADRNSVFVVDATTDSKLAEIKVGRQQEKVLAAANDVIYVTNRLGRSVSVIHRGATTETARLEVGVEPVSLAISADQRTLYVVNAAALDDTEFGTLMAFDTKSLTLKWELPVGHEPRAIAVLEGEKALVSLYKDGEVTLVDLAKKTVISASNGLYQQLNRSTLGISNGGDVARPPRDIDPVLGARTAHATGLDALLTNAEGTQVYAAAMLSSDQTLLTKGIAGVKPSDVLGSTGSGYAGGNCGAAAVASPAILTFDTLGQPLVDDVASCVGERTSERPPMMLTSNLPGLPVQGPVALALDPTGAFLFVANRESNNIAIVPAMTRVDVNSGNVAINSDVGGFDRRSAMGTVKNLVTVGAAPTGVALSHDGARAWVYNAFDHSISRLESKAGVITNVATTQLGEDVLPTEVVVGRKLFFSATDARMNNPATGIACASCHLEGREDGHVWNTVEGPRQTPSLAGRMTEKTAPFHWNGEFPDLMDFMSHTVTSRMGGSGVSPVMEKQIAAFIATIPAADNALVERTPVDVLGRGRAAFEKAQCASCHTGEAMTDNKFANVGTLVAAEGRIVFDRPEFNAKGLNTPSLLGISRSAPYLHDGSAVTLRARIMQNKSSDLHGKTAQLTETEVSDLVTYLKTL